MLSDDRRQTVTLRLEELKSHHGSTPLGPDVRYYEPGRGYLAAEGQARAEEPFGLCLATWEGELFGTGDTRTPFALQSISKVFTYALALTDLGRDAVLRRVGVEPSGDAFHSIVLDERNDRPHNPMVNAGALVTTSLVTGDDPRGRLLDLLRACADNDALAGDPATFAAEMRLADRNRATAYLLRSEGMLAGDVDAILALYLEMCSVLVTCEDLALMAATLANGGVQPRSGRRVLSPTTVRDVLSVMHTCGMYDYAGEWAFQVGIPAKSGVSGGILAVIPGKLGVGVFSPALDVYGNSVRGIAVCQELSARLGLHLLASDAEDEMLGPEAREVGRRAARGG